MLSDQPLNPSSKATAIPIITPILSLLKSRKFVVAILTAALILLGIQYPVIVPQIPAILLVCVTLILGISAEDAARFIAERPKTLAEAAAVISNEAVQTLAPAPVATVAPVITPEFVDAVVRQLLMKLDTDAVSASDAKQLVRDKLVDSLSDKAVG